MACEYICHHGEDGTRCEQCKQEAKLNPPRPSRAELLQQAQDNADLALAELKAFVRMHSR
jgi:hypothetical protein